MNGSRTSPYMVEHDGSVAGALDRARPPRGLTGLLRWFVTAWEAEVPMAIHAAGVWRDHVKPGEAGGGGSALGAPRFHDAFRAYIEGSPHQTDARNGEDEREAVYVRPIHSALARLGRHPDSEQAGVARFLFALACSGGDWRAVTSSIAWSTPTPLARPATEGALWLLWERYQHAPRREV